jgi:hypothetical protein
MEKARGHNGKCKRSYWERQEFIIGKARDLNGKARVHGKARGRHSFAKKRPDIM